VRERIVETQQKPCKAEHKKIIEHKFYFYRFLPLLSLRMNWKKGS
jgi:hypothetical protein